jgi:superfamily I DNA/RNA helicase/RecB family exonuclease
MTPDQGDRPAYRLVRTPPRVDAAPDLDLSQQAVVDLVVRPGHGPVLVLAGPGTGKTTTLVEAVAARVAAGTDPDRILTLTFGRKAAGELRDRISARLGQTVMAQSAWTFHAFAYALAGETRSPEDVGRPLRLLSGPEQDVVVRDLLAGDLDEGLVGWPHDLAVALRTRGFADEVRALLARARGLGMEPAALRRIAGPVRPDWAAAADFLAEYLDVLDARGLLDYGELVHRAVMYAESGHGRDLLRGRYDLVVVDEYQDTDSAQERLLRALAGDGRDLVVVGDPDQSIYAFRGAEVRGLLEFRDRFRSAAGARAQVRTLQVSRRAGADLLAASRQVARRMPLAGAGLADHLREHRALVAADGLAPGVVEVLTFPSGGAQLEAVADVLRREHLDGGTPWSQMAVLVRSGARSVPSVRRVLGTAGVPLEVAGDELPLSREAAAAPLLLALRVVADPDGFTPQGALTADVARTLLVSPLGRAEVSGLRRLGRLLREEERAASVTPDNPLGRLPRPSDELVREAVAEPERLVSFGDTSDRVVGPALRLGRMLARARELVESGASAYDVLWSLWDATSWPRQLERAAMAGGPTGRAADRDLDVVVALFDVAARDAERAERRGIGVFLDELEAQQIPADTLAEQGLRGEGVRVLTAHRSKGLEWPVVVVVDVQEDVWPDLRHRGSLLQADRLGDDGLTEPLPASARLAEERRLFYVATTRARRRLVVTAVDSPEDDGVRPSRFLSELGVPPTVVGDRPQRSMTLSALVAELRSVAADGQRPEAVRRAAAERLATLAAATEGPVGLVPSAHPDRWWGVAEVSEPDLPLYPVDQPIALSGSSLTGLSDCPLRWFLEHEVHADSARSTALGFGSIVHALAHEVARSDVPPGLDQLDDLVDSVWNQLAFEAPWRSAQEKAQAHEALARFVRWHAADRGRTLVGTESRFEVEVTAGGRRVVLRGLMDRIEVDVEGQVHVVDLKTSKNPPAASKVAEFVQLGVYQTAVLQGAVEGRSTSGGAELVQLRNDAKGAPGTPLVQRQEPLLGDDPDDPDRTWMTKVLDASVVRLVAEDFSPRPHEWCRFCAFHSVCPTRDEGRQVIT